MGYPQKATFKVKLVIIETRVFHTKKEHIYMGSYGMSVVYLCRTIPCLKGFTLFHHIPQKDGMHMSQTIY